MNSVQFAVAEASPSVKPLYTQLFARLRWHSAVRLKPWNLMQLKIYIYNIINDTYNAHVQFDVIGIHNRIWVGRIVFSHFETEHSPGTGFWPQSFGEPRRWWQQLSADRRWCSPRAGLEIPERKEGLISEWRNGKTIELKDVEKVGKKYEGTSHRHTNTHKYTSSNQIQPKRPFEENSTCHRGFFFAGKCAGTHKTLALGACTAADFRRVGTASLDEHRSWTVVLHGGYHAVMHGI